MYKDKKLYRKENKSSLSYIGHKDTGGDFRHDRNTKRLKNFEGNRWKMSSRKERGVDFTPLYKFLLSKVGEDFDEVYSEAMSRMDGKRAPIFWMIVENTYIEEGILKNSNGTIVRPDFNNEEAKFSTLYIDDENKLRKVSDLNKSEFKLESCGCCTQSLDGIPYVRNPIDASKVKFLKL